MSLDIQALQAKKAFICDMDGVIYHGNRIIPHVAEFVEWLLQNDKKFLFLTNSSERSPRELEMKLSRMGLKVSEDHFLHQRVGHGLVSCYPMPRRLGLRDRRAGPHLCPL